MKMLKINLGVVLSEKERKKSSSKDETRDT